MLSIKKKKWLLIGVQAVVISALVGCSDSNSGASSSPSPSTSPPATQTASPSPSSDVKPSDTAPVTASTEETMYADHAKDAIPKISEGLEMDQKTYDYVVANYKLFPAKTPEDITTAKKSADATITSKLINKNPAPYFNKMVSFEGTVVSIEETQLDGDQTIALAHVIDDNEQSYQVMIYKSTGDIVEEDGVRFWGVPVGASSFDNVSGGFTNAIFILGSVLEKIPQA